MSGAKSSILPNTFLPPPSAFCIPYRRPQPDPTRPVPPGPAPAAVTCQPLPNPCLSWEAGPVVLILSLNQMLQKLMRRARAVSLKPRLQEALTGQTCLAESVGFAVGGMAGKTRGRSGKQTGSAVRPQCTSSHAESGGARQPQLHACAVQQGI